MFLLCLQVKGATGIHLQRSEVIRQATIQASATAGGAIVMLSDETGSGAASRTPPRGGAVTADVQMILGDQSCQSYILSRRRIRWSPSLSEGGPRFPKSPATDPRTIARAFCSFSRSYKIDLTKVTATTRQCWRS
jgi:hypothetical protein